jgi:hypothetical protein
MLPIFHDVPEAAKVPNVNEVMAFRLGVPVFCVKLPNGIVIAVANSQNRTSILEGCHFSKEGAYFGQNW